MQNVKLTDVREIQNLLPDGVMPLKIINLAKII